MANPFHELYVGERISSEEFIRIFSTVLVQHAAPLFLPGNVVLAGVQGSGKSMLFKLLSPEVRQEYARAGKEFPVPKETSRFIGAGINLNQSEATHFGLRKSPEDPVLRGLLFGDFFNYVVAADVLQSIVTIAGGDPDVARDLGIDFSSERQRALAEEIRSDECWNGYLADAANLDAVRGRMRHRLAHYRQFMHANRENLDEMVLNSKTAVGEPISAVVNAIKRCGVVPKDVNFFIHVDQYEEIGTIGTADGMDYRAVVNRALNRRDPAVSYRIGTRSYAWHQSASIFGTDAKLEQERDYKFVDLDEKLRRHENPASWIFPKFARDVFARRLRNAEVPGLPANDDEVMGCVFGPSLQAREKAGLYAGRNPSRVIKLPEGMRPEVGRRLEEIAARNPLSARLGEAWVRQKGDADVFNDPPPWEEPAREWWRKERTELALAQIASATQQRQIWSGETEIIALSGGNILAFLSMCQQIWDLACQAKDAPAQVPGFPIAANIQAVGIMKASEYWLNKILQEFGRSGDRFKFVRYLGQMLSKQLLDDRRMSYPGHNGFSLRDDELERAPVDVRELLTEAGEYGNLVMLSHTTKERDRAPRTKWYVSPVYCPFLRLPFNRSKEPIYIKVDDVIGWLIDAQIRSDDGVRRKRRARRAEAPLLDFARPE